MGIILVNTAKENHNVGLGIWICWCSGIHIMFQFLAWELRIDFERGE